MKKTAIVLIVILSLVMAISLVACDKPVTSGKLETPKVSIDGNTLIWNSVPNASGYVVKVDGVELPDIIDGTSYTSYVDKEGKHTMSVKAKGKGAFTDSDFSKPLDFYVTKRLARPELTTQIVGDEVTFSWKAVPNAEKYRIKIGLNLNETEWKDVAIDKTSVTVNKKEDKVYNAIGVYKAQVYAVAGANKEYADSQVSNMGTYTNSRVLAKPTGFKYEGGYLKWISEDENVTHFKVEATEKNPPAGSEPKVYVYDKQMHSDKDYSLSYDYLRIDAPGEYEITVYAYNRDQSEIYKNSEKADAVVNVTKLAPVVKDSFKIRDDGHTLEWSPVAGASGYYITATTEQGTSFPIEIKKAEGSSIIPTSIDLDTVKGFKEDGKVYRVFTFNIFAKGSTKDVNALAMDSTTITMNKGNYYQYKAVKSDYEGKDELKGYMANIFPEKVGEGQDAYYAVKNFPQLMWSLENAGNVTIKLVENIEFPSTEFISPISSFNGVFDGNNRIISRIVMGVNDANKDRFTRNKDNVSIFGVLGSNAVVKNLVVQDVNINIKDDGLNNGVIASVNNGTIENVIVVGNIKTEKGNFGGVVYENNGKMDSVYFSGNIIGKNVGGIAVINRSGKSITNSTANGNITGYAINGELYVGGLVARNMGTITRGISSAVVIANSTVDTTYVALGGLVGLNDTNASITYSYFTRSVEAQCSNLGVMAYTGGFAGHNKGEIKYSYVNATGEIKRTDDTPFLAGFAGKNEKTISNCYSNIAIPSIDAKNKAAFVADNTNGTITSCTFHRNRAGYNAGDEALAVLPSMQGTIDAQSKAGLNNDEMQNATEILGAEFIANTRIKGSMPILAKNIYLSNDNIPNITRGIDLSTEDNYNKFYFGGEEKKVSTQIKANPYAGYQIVKYTVELEGETIVFNKLIKVI